MTAAPDPDRRPARRRPGSNRTVPGWLVIPVAAAAGFVTTGWPGLAFGALLGFFLWKIRS